MTIQDYAAMLGAGTPVVGVVWWLASIGRDLQAAVKKLEHHQLKVELHETKIALVEQRVEWLHQQLEELETI